MVTVVKGNKREVPAGMPILAWAERVRRVTRRGKYLAVLPFYDSRMEFLSPDELRKLRAKVFVWREITGEWPENLEVWWEIRQARKRGDLPHETAVTTVKVIEDVTHCGKCGARWSAPAPERCGLCDALWIEEIPNAATAPD